jgi:hypothetical protein
VHEASEARDRDVTVQRHDVVLAHLCEERQVHSQQERGRSAANLAGEILVQRDLMFAVNRRMKE